MKSRRILGIIIVFIICAAFALVGFRSSEMILIKQMDGRNVRYILDAGHGHPDGGAVAADGTTESSLNLMITNKLAESLKKNGITYQLMRSTEASIYSEGKTIHEKKVSDIRNRIKIASALPNTPLISIHMNSYPDPSVYGIQVFYGNTDSAQLLAHSLQSAINDRFQSAHPKPAKEVSKNIYLFSHVENPIILIECGFLSNTDELKKLKSQEYQQDLADLIAEVLAGRS